MSDILIWLSLGIVIGIWLFYLAIKIALHVLTKKLERDLGNLEQTLEQYRDENTIPCRVELHDDVFFVYNDDTDEFMAQGRDLVELRERIQARWADRRVSVVAGDDDVLKILKAQLNESSSSQ